MVSLQSIDHIRVGILAPWLRKRLAVRQVWRAAPRTSRARLHALKGITHVESRRGGSSGACKEEFGACKEEPPHNWQWLEAHKEDKAAVRWLLDTGVRGVIQWSNSCAASAVPCVPDRIAADGLRPCDSPSSQLPSPPAAGCGAAEHKVGMGKGRDSMPAPPNPLRRAATDAPPHVPERSH